MGVEILPFNASTPIPTFPLQGGRSFRGRVDSPLVIHQTRRPDKRQCIRQILAESMNCWWMRYAYPPYASVQGVTP